MPQTTEKFIRINEDGTSEFCTLNRSPRLISQAFARQFAGDAKLSMRNVMEAKVNGFPPFVTHLVASNTQRLLVTKLPFLRLTCHFELDKEGLLVPHFFNRNQPEKDKFIQSSLQWTPPPDMTLMFASFIRGYEAVPIRHLSTQDSKPYLIAFNPQKQAWVLPLPNLYDDCTVCNGEFNGMGGTYQSAFEKCLQQFLSAAWNTDLINNSKMEFCKSLFKFAPGSSETVQVDWAAKEMAQGRAWQALCTKAGSPITIAVGGLI